MDIKEYKRCNSSIDDPIQFNLFPRITTKYSQILFGNITLKQQLDDSLSINVLAGKYDSIGVFKENSLVNVKNACSSIKYGIYGEKTWKSFVDAFQIPTINCPWPKGPFWMDIKEYIRCNSSIEYPIQYNMFTHKAKNYSQLIFGNITLRQPFDDSMDMHILSGRHDSNHGLFKEISLVNVKNACSSMKSGMYGEKAWKSFVDAFQIPTVTCPWPKGVYFSKGFDTASMKESNMPKIIMYGRYTVRLLFLKKNNVISCTRFVVDLKPYS
ncbi:uncharacterized protein LOC126903875 isoform X2 [Daktulosphaira vitifoliae]|nr:uncharacterized protein LOC126903875 isoform X2 [Daktulosphaira vitifoliae]XP_050538367.1 uncharacterized protein LOC126903875 isoform X2 [Daktulosphaira vitifoliae]XP_050538368.1 uncharacterized protein LOC126903875 isoform X2 [Daktulosphaira vitifoliae]XP_050538369.1 uncharacterized protein LOC126903875 isoform X2 [Daktulosphaira vitifoliae]